MKRRTILSSILVIIACIAVISGSTFALFTSESSVNIAITSGKVSVVATLGTPSLYSADATLTEGTLVDKMNPLDKTGTILPTDPQGVFAGTYYYKNQTTEGHFLNGGTAAIEDGVLNIKKITPGDKVSTNVKITNESNVDIQYRVKINVLSGLKLYEGLVVKVDGLSLQGIQKVGNWIYMSIPTTEEEKTIATIPVDIYLPLDAGNEYQDLSTSIQFTVEAVQGNAKTTNETLAQVVNVEKTVAETAASSGQVITDEDQLVEVSVPAAAFTNNDITVSTNDDTTTSLSVKIEPQDTISDINLTSTQTAQSYDLEVLIKTQVGEAAPTEVKYNKDGDANATALKIKMFVGTGLTGVKLYHITTPLTSVASLSDVDELNEYYYDSTEGYITLMTNSFSEYTVIYNKDIAVETVDELTQKSTISVYTPTEDSNVYEDVDGNIVKITVDENKEVSVSKNGVAYIAKTTGTVFYDTLAAAIAAVVEGETIVMTKDSTSTDGYEINKTISLDTNGKTITVTSGSNVNSRAFKVTSGKFTVYGGGTIDAQGAATSTTGTDGTGCYGAFRAEVETELSLSDLTLKNYRPWGLNVKVLGASATLDNVKIVSVCGGGIEVTDDDGANGNVQGYARLTNCTMTQSDFRDWCSAPVSVSGNSKIDVYSTEYVGEYGVFVFSSGGTINIYGGSFTATSHDVLETSYDPQYGNDSIINVYGGTFVGTIKDVSSAAHEFINIYGGTFDHDPSAYVSNDYVVNYENEKYTVVSKLSILSEQLTNLGYTNVTINSNKGFVKGTFTDNVVYRFYSLNEAYVDDPTNYNGFAGSDVAIDNSVYYVGKLVPVIGIVENGFTNQTTITKLVICSELIDTWKALKDNTTITTVEYTEGVTTVTNRFFFSSKVQNVILSNTITTIENYAFYNNAYIENLVIPASVTSIGEQAFRDLASIKTITIKGSPIVDVYYIGRNCGQLTDVYFEGESAVFTNSRGISQTFTNAETGAANSIVIHFATQSMLDSFKSLDSSSQGLTFEVIEQ